MKRKIFALIIGLIFLIFSLLFIKSDNVYRVQEIISPVSIVINNTKFEISDLDCFDSSFSEKNKYLAEKLNITETEAFLIGNLGKYWASGLLKGRPVYITDDNDLVYLKYSYKHKFMYSGYCLKNSAPFYKEGFEKILNNLRKTKYAVLDLDTDSVYEPSNSDIKNLKNYLVIKKIHLPRQAKNIPPKYTKSAPIHKDFGKIRVFYTDSTTKLKPDRTCQSSICKEILNNINQAKESIDIAIYGYSRTPEIERALKSAMKRGVKVRLVYDTDTNGGNIYPDTEIITNLIPNNRSDKDSSEFKNIMHNKFYIFDNKILITGSANLSHTDMSGFNSNSMVVIDSPEIANIYKTEFENMFNGKFHNDKPSIKNKVVNVSGVNVTVYFSPQDKGTKNAIIPLINNAKSYIYIPTFVLTDKGVTASLIEAKKRGVDVKIIIDALNASVQHSKHKELRGGGIPVKTENYAGKMHSKSIIIDDEYTIIGSMNFSNSGENRNDENLIVIENPEIAKSYKDFFLYQWNRIDDKWLKFNARAEGKDSIGSCSDGLDNNYDGLTDMEDPACRG